MTRIRIAVAADHEVVRVGLRLSLESEPDFEVAGEATSSETAIVLARETEPDVMLLDVEPRESGMAGPQTCRGVLAASPRTAVLILASHRQDAVVVQSLAAGARGYLAKGVDLAELKRVVRDVHRGVASFDGGMPRGAIVPTAAPHATGSAPNGGDTGLRLSHVDLTIIRLLAQGMSNKEIGARLHLSPYTVKDHVKKIASSFSVRSRTEIVVHALRQGLV